MQNLGPLFFGTFTAIHATVAVLALLLIGDYPVAALCLFAVEFVTAYDNCVIVLGRRIGISERALRLNRTRFLLHAVVIGLLVPVYVAIAGALAVAPFASRGATILALLVAGLIAAFGYFAQYRQLKLIMPVNYFGCLRYAQSVDDARRYPGYRYSEAELESRAVPPLASIITVLIGLVLSAWIAWSAGFLVPLVVTGLMFLAASFPARSWGPLVTSMLEIVFSAGLFWSLWQISMLA